MRAEATRRGLLLGAGAAGAAAVLAPARGLASGDDAAILGVLIRRAQTNALAYKEIARDPGIARRLREAVRHFRRQDEQHAAALIRALGHLGGTPPARPTSVPGLDRALAGGQGPALRFAIALEDRSVGACHDALARLDDSRLLQTTAEIMGNEGQHLVGLRQWANLNPVPNAFETGDPG